MSGIAVTTGVANDTLVCRMLDKLQHRGPDDNQVYTNQNVVLGCTVLAVDDRSSRQPEQNGSNPLSVVADARIYNYRTLRDKLSNSSEIHSEADLILRLYKEYGPCFVKDIDGIFAIAIHDSKGLFVARDPLGVKPLYCARDNGHRYFASELKALSGGLKEVQAFPAGHYYQSGQGFTKYFDFDPSACVDGDADHTVAELRSLLDTAVQKRLPRNGEVGILLSGGLDSSTIGFLVSQYSDKVHSFTSGIGDSEDVIHARALAEKLNMEHHECIYSVDEMLEALPQVIYHLESFDYLLVRSSIANYFASKMAGEHVKVVLCGEGADELFAGYDHLKDYTCGVELNNTLAEMVLGCHNTGLQRVDRMNMANGVEGRMPFFDLELLEFAFTVPACYKVHSDTGTEKWIIRKAFENDLPDSITWRGKQKFSQGAGSYELMSELAESRITDEEFISNRRLSNGHILRNKEEMMYYRIFKDLFGNAPEVLNTVGITSSD